MRLHCRFVTRQELDRLALGHLVGTPLLRAYMHGFFVDNRLYRKAKVRRLAGAALLALILLCGVRLRLPPWVLLTMQLG